MAASSDPWASVFLNAAGEAPPECQVEKEVSKSERQDTSVALDAFLEKGKKVETGAFEHKFDAHVIGEFRNAFCSTSKKKHRSTRVVKIKNALPHEVAVGALHCIKAAGDKHGVWQRQIQIRAVAGATKSKMEPEVQHIATKLVMALL